MKPIQKSAIAVAMLVVASASLVACNDEPKVENPSVKGGGIANNPAVKARAAHPDGGAK